MVAYFMTQCVYFYVFHGTRSHFTDLDATQQGILDLFLGLFAGNYCAAMLNIGICSAE